MTAHPTTPPGRDDRGHYYDWRLTNNLDFFFEIPTERVRPHLPAGLSPAEVRPGTALLSIGAITFPAGNGDNIPACSELSFSLLVTPSLSREVPRFASCVHRITSDSQEFLDWSRLVDHMPIYHAQNFQLRIDPWSHLVEAWDDHGPILSIQSTHPSPSFQEELIPVQIYTDQGGLKRKEVLWFGEMMQHQRSGAGAQRLHPHPFWGGVDIEGCEQHCYLQMLARPQTEAVMRLYLSEPVR